MALDTKKDNIIKHPFGEQEVQNLTFADPLPVTIKNSVTLVNVTPTADFTLDLTLDPNVNFSANGGEQLVLRGTPDGAWVIAVGTGMGGEDVTMTTVVVNTVTFERGSDGLFYVKSQA